MGWIGLGDRYAGHFDRHGLGIARRDAPRVEFYPDALMTRGTLLFEVQAPPDTCPLQLLHFSHSRPWARQFSIQITPNGILEYIHQQENRTIQSTVAVPTSETIRSVRISYAWDSIKGIGRLAAEHPGQLAPSIAYVKAPMPLLVSDLETEFGNTDLPGELAFRALSADIEPLGPTGALAPQTPIATPSGYQSVGDLRRGDCVVTHDGQVMPILHCIHQFLPTRGSFQPVQLFAPYFGLTSDIVVSAAQRVVIEGSDVGYMFNTDSVLLPARNLINTQFATQAPLGPVMLYVQLVLPEHDVLDAAGAMTESLYIGRLRRNVEHFFASAFAHEDRNTLPEHGQPISPALNPFDAIALAQQLTTQPSIKLGGHLSNNHSVFG